MNKQFKTLITILFMGVCIILYNSTLAQDTKKSPSLVGTYIYTLDDQEGMCIITKTHFTSVLSNKNRKSFQAEEPTDSEKSVAYMSANAEGGTYKFVGPSRVTVHRLYSTNPSLVGKEYTLEYEFEGDLCKYWILRADGTRGQMGSARRIEK